MPPRPRDLGFLCPERFRFPRLRLLPDPGDRPLLSLIDERPVDVFAARRALNDNAATGLPPDAA